MIKPITTSPFVKRAVVSAMMAGAVATGVKAANSHDESIPEQPMYTEISSEASSAVRAAVLSQVNQDDYDGLVNGAVVLRIANLLKNTTRSEYEQIEALMYLENITHQCLGLYGAAVELQAQCSELALVNMVDDCVQKNSRNLSSYQRIQLNALKKHIEDGTFFAPRRNLYDNITGYQSANYKKPTADETLDELDEIAATLLASHKDLYDEYTTAWKNLDSIQNGSTTPTQKANLISFKVFYIDIMAATLEFGKRGLGSLLTESLIEYIDNYIPNPIV